MIAILEASKAGLLNARNILRNVSAGIIVGIVALPLAMAFAIASGTTPQQGLYTAIVAALCVSLFGGSRVQIAGPTGAFVVILAAITAQYGVTGLQIASLMAGIILLFMGLLRLGSVIKYIPESVIIGFTSGIAVIIWIGQWKFFFGLTVPSGNFPFDQQFLHLLQAFKNLDVTTTFLGILSLLILILAPKIIKKIPAPLIAMVGATFLQNIFKFKTVATLGSTFGAFPRTLPIPHFLPFSFNEMSLLVLPAFTIAMLGAIESLLSATVADSMLGTKHRPNQELLGQGIANILAPFFGGFAATGAIARTATNIRNGGNSPIAGITHSVLLILIIVFLAPLAADIPLCCLAAILFVVAYNMSEWRRFLRVCRQAPYYDVLVLVTTFLLTVFVNLVVAVNIGVILAALLFMRRMAQAVQIEKYEGDLLASSEEETDLDTVVFIINGPFFFAAVSTFEQTLENIHDHVQKVIFDFKNVPFIDGTGLLVLDDVIKKFEQQHVKVVLRHVNERILQKLKRAKLVERVILH